MRRREFIARIGSAAAVSALLMPVARAQEPGRTRRDSGPCPSGATDRSVF